MLKAIIFVENLKLNSHNLGEDTDGDRKHETPRFKNG
jgi:hypothetical protein